MITWIQTYFQHHFRSIFAVLLGVVIISFVFGINASGGFGRADQVAADRLFFGKNLSSEQEGGRLIRDGSYSAQLRGAGQLDEGMIQQYALSRVAGLAVADELHLPVPTEKEVAAHIASLRYFQDQQGNFDQKRYATFADAIKTNPQFGTADALRVFRDDARLEVLHKLFGGPGYVQPADVRDLLSRTDAKWSVAIATLDYAGFDPGVTVTDEALKKFFDERTSAGTYVVQPRAKLSYVAFKGADFAPAGPLSEEQVRAYYNANPSRFPVPADPAAKDASVPVPSTGADNFTKVRAQVETALRNEQGARAAVKASTDFTVALYNHKAAANSPELAAFLASEKRAAIALEPFTADNPPAAMPWLAYYGEQVSRLNKDRFFSDPLQTPDGAIVLLWHDTLPAYQPAFAEVKEKVTADYNENEKRKRFVAQGQLLQARLSAAVKAGTPFEKAAADAKLETKSFANFTLQDIPKDFPGEARQALQTLKPGEISEIIPSADKGYLVYAAQKLAPDLTPANPRFAEIRTRLMGYLSTSNGAAIINDLVKAELDKTAPASSVAAK